MEDFATLMGSLLVIPLLSTALIAVCFRTSPTLAKGTSVIAAGITALAAITYLLLDWNGSPQCFVFPWLQLGDWTLELGFWLDEKSAPLLAVVTGIGFLIHLFSIGYMEDDLAQPRYFGALSFFMFSMIGIVLAPNLFMMFVFWELVGFSSYALIAHYWEKPVAAEASKKAFVANRIGDLGFLVGIAWAFQYYGTVDFAQIAFLIESGSHDAMTGIGLCLICGFIGKSAQFPLQVWLTDAMAGPTPVSALIHAATMVAAGIFLLVRIDPILTETVISTILWLGALMVFFAGFWALGQTDIKKSLAYSTLSHLGYMATAVGLGMPDLAMLHLAMHACFKACLFLCAGSVIHSCHHEQNMFRMGGLWKKLPITFAAFVIATLSLCAVWPFAGYFSKEGIIGSALAMGSGETGQSQYLFIFGLTLAGALASGLYMGRMLFVVFFGKPNSVAAAKAEELNPWITVPLVLLAFLSLSAGLFVANGIPHNLVAFLEAGHHHAHELIHEAHLETVLMILGLAVGIFGLAGAWLFYGMGAPEDRLRRRIPFAFYALERHGWFDDLYAAFVKFVHDPIAKWIAIIDLAFISLVLVQGVGAFNKVLGTGLKSVQNGSVRGYLFWFASGVILFGAYAIGIL